MRQRDSRTNERRVGVKRRFAEAEMGRLLEAARTGLAPLNGSGAEQDSRNNDIVANARREFTSAFGDLARGKRN